MEREKSDTVLLPTTPADTRVMWEMAEKNCIKKSFWIQFIVGHHFIFASTKSPLSTGIFCTSNYFIEDILRDRAGDIEKLFANLEKLTTLTILGSIWQCWRLNIFEKGLLKVFQLKIKPENRRGDFDETGFFRKSRVVPKTPKGEVLCSLVIWS